MNTSVTDPGPVRRPSRSWTWLLLSSLAWTALLGACRSTPEGTRAELFMDLAVVTHDGEPFAVVHLAAEPRPFVHPLVGPDGLALTRGFPMDPQPGEARDHPHHQSLWFAHGDVGGYDFWHGAGHDERIVWDGDLTIENTDAGSLVRAGYRWMADEDTLVCTEERELRFDADDEARRLDVTITLRPERGALVFGDTKEGSFALRVHPALRVEGDRATGTLINSEGDRDAAVWGRRARWIDDSGTIAGRDVGIALFDHPRNPRHPTWWHARNYGLLAANPFGLHDFEGRPAGSGDLSVAPGEVLRLEYRVLLHGADWDAARIEAAYRAWVTE